MSYYMRNVTRQDVDIIFEWVNDPVTRRNSFNCETIDYESHVVWFNNVMRDQKCYFWILMEEYTPVGQVRLCCDDKRNAEISYSISPSNRNRGLGTIILEEALKKIEREGMDIKKVVAKVKPENMASIHLFEKMGFEEKFRSFELELGK